MPFIPKRKRAPIRIMVIETKGRAIDAVLCSSARLDFPDLVPVEKGFRVGGFQSIECLPFARNLQRAQGFHVAVVAQTDGVSCRGDAVQNGTQQSHPAATRASSIRKRPPIR